jgi:hypothetical protein
MDSKKYLLNKVISNLSLEITVDAESCRQQGIGGKASHYDNGTVKILLASADDQQTLMHEVVHAIQFKTGGFKFSNPQLRSWLELHGLEFDEAFHADFLPFWRESWYWPDQFFLEYLAYYCERASNGWQVFQLLCRQAGVLKG